MCVRGKERERECERGAGGKTEWINNWVIG